MNSYQIGAVMGKSLFPVFGPAGTTALRLTVASVLLALAWRPWRLAIDGRRLVGIGAYGACLGALNLLFAFAFRTLPLGVCIAIVFTGPLVVAGLGARSLRHAMWIALAAAGVLLLLPTSPWSAPLDPTGLAFAFGAASFWGLYIVLGRGAGVGLHSGRVTALGVLAGAVVTAPFGLASGPAPVLEPAVIAMVAAVAVFSSAVPNWLEMVALPRMSTRLYGVLMSLEPAFGVGYGFLLLREIPTLLQGVGIATIVLASIGMTFAERGRPLPTP